MHSVPQRPAGIRTGFMQAVPWGPAARTESMGVITTDTTASRSGEHIDTGASEKAALWAASSAAVRHQNGLRAARGAIPGKKWLTLSASASMLAAERTSERGRHVTGPPFRPPDLGWMARCPNLSMFLVGDACQKPSLQADSED